MHCYSNSIKFLLAACCTMAFTLETACDATGKEQTVARKNRRPGIVQYVQFDATKLIEEKESDNSVPNPTEHSADKPDVPEKNVTEPIEEPQEKQPKPANVYRIRLEGAILKTIDSTSISAQVAGVLREASVKEGTIVKKGELLGKVDDASVALKLEQLKTQVLIAKRKKDNTIDKEVAVKNRDVAETEYQRALAANKLVPNTYPLNEIDRLKLVAERSQLEVHRADYDTQMAALDVEVAISEFNQTKELLGRHSIVAPVDGMIVGVDKRLGEWVEPGTEIIKIVRTDTLRIEGLIPAASDDGAMVGRDAEIELVRGEERQKFSGKVVFVSPDVNPVNSLARVFIEVENLERKLRPGLPVQAEIIRINDQVEKDASE